MFPDSNNKAIIVTNSQKLLRPLHRSQLKSAVSARPYENQALKSQERLSQEEPASWAINFHIPNERWVQTKTMLIQKTCFSRSKPIIIGDSIVEFKWSMCFFVQSCYSLSSCFARSFAVQTLSCWVSGASLPPIRPSKPVGGESNLTGAFKGRAHRCHPGRPGSPEVPVLRGQGSTGSGGMAFFGMFLVFWKPELRMLVGSQTLCYNL